MRYRIVPLFSAKAEAILFEVYDAAGHCMILEPDELRDAGGRLGEKIVFDNFDITREEKCRMLHEGRRSARAFARRHGLI